MTNYLLKITLALLLLVVFNSTAQTKLSFGAELSPSVKLQTIRNKVTGLFTSISGYGFNVGIPVKYKLEDFKTISTGITYEFTAFDTRINTTLINSLRLNSINIPITYNYPITENYFVNLGGGMNYIFSSKEYGGGIWTAINPIISKVQPYISLGGSLLKNKNLNFYELGFNARYYIRNLWTLNTLTSTNIVSIDLNLKYFF